jgi:DNA-binding transcriptional ArsR family regulator
MVVKRLGTYDPYTGELLDDIQVVIRKKSKSPYGKQWMIVNLNFLAEFAARKDTGFQVLRVFLHLNSQLDFENLVHVSQVAISESLDMHPSDVSRAIKKLVDLGVLIKGPKIGVSNTYRLNPRAGWRGRVSDFDKAIRQAPPVLRVVEP